MSLNEVAEKALEHGADLVVIVDRWQSGPCKIEFFHVGASGLVSVPSVLYIAGLRLQRELVQEKWKHVRGLVITQPEGDSTEIAESLSKFFNIPLLPEKDSSKYSITMHISHNTRGQVQITFMQLPQKVEIGPRITLRRME
jgi:rRNA maturation protein Rpf1